MIGAMTIDLFSDQLHSLKEKRQLLSSLKERLRHQFNIAAAESDFQDTWQKAQLSVVSTSNSKVVLEKLFRQIEEFIFANYAVQIIRIDIAFY